jgi:hypothetical protein
MTTSGTWYYPPCAGTGNLLLTNPPFILHLMDTNQPTPTEGLPELTKEQFERLIIDIGSNAFCIAQLAYQMGADVELEACCQWLHSAGNFELGIKSLRAARRPKPPTLKEQALAILDDCNLDAAHENTLRRALEALPE